MAKKPNDRRKYEKDYEKYEEELANKAEFDFLNPVMMRFEDNLKEYKQHLEEVVATTVDPPVSYDDGDQSLVSGRDVRILLNRYISDSAYTPLTHPSLAV